MKKRAGAAAAAARARSSGTLDRATVLAEGGRRLEVGLAEGGRSGGDQERRDAELRTREASSSGKFSLSCVKGLMHAISWSW